MSFLRMPCLPTGRQESINNSSPVIIDLGTGSGCIAISIAKNNPTVKIFATDASEKALEVARLNAKFHKVDRQILFLQSDLLSFTHQGSDPQVSVIVTNLPYIPTYRLPYLDPSVYDYEPRIALDGGSDGFELYRKFLKQIKEKNFYPKMLVAEIDYTQAETAKEEAEKLFPKAQVEIKTDLVQKQRILKISFI